MIHTSTEELRARMRAYLQGTAGHKCRFGHQLDGDQHRLLQEARAAGGRITVSDLPLPDLVVTANAAFELQHRGLARTSIRFAGHALPEGVRVELTEAGSRYLRAIR